MIYEMWLAIESFSVVFWVVASFHWLNYTFDQCTLFNMLANQHPLMPATLAC